MEYYYYIILFFIILIIFRLYVKLTYKFWAYQPVFHYYNLLYWIYPIGIINKELPKSNKYCNFINITTKNYFDCSNNEIDEIIDLIKNNYNRNSDANYLPDKNNFTNYFIGHTQKSYISMYINPLYKLDNEKKSNIIKENEIIGVITGRPISITLKNTPKQNAYYVDFLCVKKEHREKHIAPQLIQTYEYSQRHNNKESSISLFKREGKLTGIVPLTAYKTYMFYTKSIKIDKIDVPSLIEISEVNFHLLTNFIDYNKKNFDCIITVNKSNLLNLILKNIYKVYGILNNKELICCYFFKQNNMIYNVKNTYENRITTSNSIDLALSINNTNNDVFINGFIIALKKFKKDYINIENISNNNIIIDNLLKKSLNPKFQAPMAYFFYNYANRPLPSNNVIIIV